MPDMARNTPVTPEELVARFWSKVRKLEGADACWLWTDRPRGKGYGRFRVRKTQRGAHVFSYELHFGSVPDGFHVHHKCENKLCVRPDHLEAVDPDTHLTLTPGSCRNKTHCKRGHEFTPANTYHNNGKRSCRQCLANKSAQRAVTHRARMNAQARWRRKLCRLSVSSNDLETASSPITET